MTKNQKKIKPDSAEKIYWKQKNEFADLFNAYLYNGRQIIVAEDLEEQDTDVTTELELGEIKESIQGARDIIRLAKRYKGVEYAILAIENQEGVHYAMPIRVLGYDYSTYHRQYRDRVSEYKARGVILHGDELISGIRKNDRFIPVITIVLYYGETPWDGPQCLQDMLDIPEEIKPHVSNYNLHVIDVKNNSLELKNQNNIDLFKILSIIYNSAKTRDERKEELRQYEENHVIEDRVIDVVASTTNVTIEYSKEGNRKMCTLWEEVKEEGREEGREVGREEGILSSITSLMETLQFSAEQAMDALKISAEEKQKYSALLTKNKKYFCE